MQINLAERRRISERVAISEQPYATSSPSARDGTPSSPSPRDGATEFEVFLSFRGKDTRNGFTGHLHQSLKDKGIHAFIDNEDLEKGQRVDKLFGYIAKSKIVVPIFSERYADSEWCLKEIAEAVECKTLIIPVFFGVDPTHVRHQSGPFESSFEQHQQNKSLDQREVEKWGEALRQAGKISGFNLTTDTNRHEAKLVQIIVKRILDELNKNTFCVEKYVVGLDKSVEDVMHLLDLQEDTVRAVGIFGMGGLGKTTLAEAVHNKICTKFDASCFIYSIRSEDIPSLQMQLLHDVFGEDVKINNATQGMNLIKKRINRKRVLLILDDIDKKEQFSNLAGSTDWFCKGSRIIITTREKSVLRRAGVNEDNIYELGLLNERQSLELFSYHAFRRKEPIEGYDQLSRKVASVAAGLPLALEVFGSQFFDLDNPRKWETMLDKLQNRQNEEIHDTLKISFEGLDKGEKEIFLDIACFFIGEDKTYATYMWEGCKFYPELSLDVLKHKSLIKISSDNKFVMHDQIRDMGTEIVRQEYGGDLRMRSRLWDDNEISSALQNPEGTCNTQAIVHRNWYGHCPPVNTKAFEKMTSKARLLHLQDVQFEGDECPRLPRTITWLQWCGFPFKKLPLAPRLDNIVVLHLSHCPRLTGLRLKGLNKLKVLVLEYCMNLTVTPDFSSMQHLETLIFYGCKKLVVVDESIGCLKSLVLLRMRHCRDLKELPDSLCQLSSLKSLDLSFTRISSLPKQLGDLKALECLYLRYTEIASLPDSMQQMQSLVSLSLMSCYSLEELPEFIGQLTNLQELNVAWCNGLRVLPNSIGNLRNLTSLDFSGTKIEKMPEFVGQLTNLQTLSIARCRGLRVLPNSIGNLRNLTSLDFYESAIEEIPESIGQLTNLQELSIAQCRRLRVLPNSIGNLRNLTSLKFYESAIGEIPESVGQLTNLQELNVACCHQLRVLPNSIGNLRNLTSLDFCGTKIEEIPESVGQLTNLQELNLAECDQLRVLPNSIGNLKNLTSLDFHESAIEEIPESVGQLTNLQKLDFSHSEIESLPSSFGGLSRLEDLTMNHCQGLRFVSPISNLRHLKYLSFDGCEKLANILDNIEGLNCLEELSLTGCSGLLSLPQLATSLRLLDASDCSSMRTIPDVSNLRKLFALNLTNCEKLEDVPGLEYLIGVGRLLAAGCGGGSFLSQRRLFDRINSANFPRLIVFSTSGSLGPSGTELFFPLPKGCKTDEAFLYLQTRVARKKMKEMSICIEEIDNDGGTVYTATAQAPLSFYESLLQLPEEIQTIKLGSQYRECERQRVIRVSIQNGFLIGGDLAFQDHLNDHRRCVYFTRKQYRSPTNGSSGYCVLRVQF